MLRPLTRVNTEEGPAGVEADRGPRPPKVGSASSDGTTVPDTFSDPAVMAGPLPAGGRAVQGRIESHSSQTP